MKSEFGFSSRTFTVTPMVMRGLFSSSVWGKSAGAWMAQVPGASAYLYDLSAGAVESTERKPAAARLRAVGASLRQVTSPVIAA